MNYKKRVLKLFPKSQKKEVNGKEIIFLQGEEDTYGKALIQIPFVDEDMNPWEQTWRELDIKSSNV